MYVEKIAVFSLKAGTLEKKHDIWTSVQLWQDKAPVLLIDLDEDSFICLGMDGQTPTAVSLTSEGLFTPWLQTKNCHWWGILVCFAWVQNPDLFTNALSGDWLTSIWYWTVLWALHPGRSEQRSRFGSNPMWTHCTEEFFLKP